MHSITTSLHRYFSLPLIPTADQLTTQQWSSEHSMPAHNLHPPHIVMQVLSSCTPLKFTFFLQLPSSWLSLFCRNSSIAIISIAPSPSSDPGPAREGKNVENITALDWQSGTVGTQMLHKAGLGLPGKELGKFFPTFSINAIIIQSFLCLFLLSSIQQLIKLPLKITII